MLSENLYHPIKESIARYLYLSTNIQEDQTDYLQSAMLEYDEYERVRVRLEKLNEKYCETKLFHVIDGNKC
jgi:hypothetical protein